MTPIEEIATLITGLEQESGPARPRSELATLRRLAERLAHLGRPARDLPPVHPLKKAATVCATQFCYHQADGGLGRDGRPICADCKAKMEDNRT